MVEGERYFAADADVDEEGARLRLIEQSSDLRTFRLLDRLRVGAGWRCLEVGAGAGSVAGSLGERVGPTGHVLAVDLDTRRLGWLDAPNITVRVHDIVADDLERGRFDLVHFRGLLEHIHDAQGAIKRMADALGPGGWLLCEGADFGRYRAVSRDHPLAEVFDAVMSRTFVFIRDADIFNPFVASSFVSLLGGAALNDVGVDDESVMLQGGGPMAVMYETSWQRFDAALAAHGVITEQEAAARHAAHHDPSFSFTDGAIAAWGRRP